MFQLGIIILAHKDFWNICRIINDLQYKNISIYIHVDKSNSELYTKISKLSYPNLKVFSQYRCKWGHFSIVEAMIYTMKISYKEGMDYISMVSWEDLTLQTSEKIYNFFLRNQKINFLDYRKSNWLNFWEYSNIDLYRYYIFCWRIILSIPWIRKKPLPLFYSSQWININRDTLGRILVYIDTHPEYSKYFSYFFSPDNFFFATIIEKTLWFGTTLNTNLRYVEWDNDYVNSDIKIILWWKRTITPRTPKILNKKYLQSLWSLWPRYLFARKYKEI